MDVCLCVYVCMCLSLCICVKNLKTAVMGPKIYKAQSTKCYQIKITIENSVENFKLCMFMLQLPFYIIYTSQPAI